MTASWIPNPYSFFLFFSALAAFGTAGVLWSRRKAPGALQLAALMAAAGFWAATYGLELGSPTLEQKLFWARIEVLAIPFTPVLSLLMIIRSLEEDHLLTRRRLAFLFAGPLVSILLYWSNDWHGWLWQNMHLIPAGPIDTLKADHRWFYWLYLSYSYLLLALGGGLLIRAYRRARGERRRQIRLVLIGMALIAAINFFTQLPVSTLPDLDWTPFSFTLLGIFSAWGLFRLHFFQLPSLKAETFEPLVTPHISLLLKEDHQRARTLAVLSLLLIGLLILAAAFNFFIAPVSLVYLAATALAFVLAYALSRTPYYKAGIWLLLGASAILPAVAVITMPAADLEQALRYLTWGLPALILGGWLLSSWEVWALLALMASGYGLVLRSFGPLSFADVFNLFGLMVEFTALSYALYLLRQRNLRQISQVTSELERSQAYLTTVINSLGNPFYVVNTQDYTIALANEAAKQLGIGSQSTCYALTHQRETPCSGAEHPCPLQYVREHKQPYTVEHVHYRPDGSTYHAEVHGYPILDETGNVVQMIEYSLDITARKQAEAEIRKLTRSIEESASSVVITNAEGTIEYVNPAFERISGYSAVEAIGNNPRILKSGKMPPNLYKTMWQTLMQGKVWRGEMINRKKDGQLYWEFSTISPVLDENGRITHFVAIKEDITERKRIEEALVLERQKSDALLRNILPETIAAEIKEQGYATPTLLEDASVLFADFVDFTHTAEQLSPQELVDMLDVYFSAFDEIMEAYGLEKLKTIGDSYMCAAGLPAPNPHHAVDITRAAFAMLDFVAREKARRQEQGQPAWDIRIGISSGPLVAGVVGRKKYAYDVWGDTVVMAARMEQAGAAGRINVSQSTYERIRTHFLCQYRGKVTAKHKGQVNMYFVLSPR